MDINLFRAIQLLAIRDAENPTFDSWYASIERWYSEKFSTSLIEVEKLPIEKVLKTYFEDHYTNLLKQATNNEEAEKIYYEIRNAIVYPDEIVQASIEDDEWEREMIAQVREDEERMARANEMADRERRVDEKTRNSMIKARSQAKKPTLAPGQPAPKPKENLNLVEEPASLQMPADFKDSIPDG